MFFSDDVKYTLEDAKEDAELMYSRANDMSKIKLKCWIAYCEYAKREENAERAMRYDNYCHLVIPDTYIGHINSGEINCDDIGGKEVAVNIVKKWFNLKD